jgi:uncharacterized protein YdaL
MSVPCFAETQKSNESVQLEDVIKTYDEKDNHGKMYVLIDEIYAFSDLNMLSALAEKFYDNGIPFIVSVMPVYENFDYPAFKRYTQVLRYIQSKNASIVMHDPFIKYDEMESEAMEQRLDRAKKALINEGIDIWAFDEKPFSLKYNDIKALNSNNRKFGLFKVDTMLTYNLPETEEELNQDIKQINSMWLTISDYKRNFTDKSYAFNEEAYDEAYSFTKKETNKFDDFFNLSNYILLGFVGTSVIVFTGFIIIGNKLYKRKFMR